MSSSLSAERDRIQREVEELEQSLYVNDAELDLLSSDTDDESDDEDDEDDEDDCNQSAGLMEQRDKIQKEIHNLENVLGEPGVDDSSSDESELGLSLSVESCLQVNLVYQQVLQETLDQLETLLTHNLTQQKELMSQLSGPIREPPREQTAPSSYQQPITMYLGRFLKPYFKDKLTGLGPPANQETRERSSRMTGHLDNNRLKVRRWESWQKTLLFHSVSTDQLKRLIQPKLSKVEYLSHKLLSAGETDRQQLQQQIDGLEREIDLLRGKKEDELVGERHDEHDWEKISNIDFEGTREAADIRCFWQNFLHPSIKKSQWSREEVQQLGEVSRRREERHWEEISEELGTGRTAFMCLQTFQKFLSKSLRRSSWTPAEDDLLRQLVNKMRIGNFIPYTQMSYFMEGRQPSQLIYRWNQVLDPAIKRGLWTEEEDQLLLQAVNRHGEKNWWKIRLEVPGRTCNSCRDRYMDCLKAGTKRGPFDQQEIELLLKLVKKHGVGRWAKIAAEIPHRIDSQCLRTWRSLGNDLEVRELAKVKRRARREAQRKAAQEQAASQKKEKKKVGVAARRNIKRNLVPVKEESSEESSEEEEMLVPYMDSDEEKERKKLVPQMEVEVKEEVKEEFYIPPMQQWIPAPPVNSSGLKFHPAALPLVDTTRGTSLVRSTILMNSGAEVVFGPPPRLLPVAACHRGAMMMVTAKDLRRHLDGLAHPSSGRERTRRSIRRCMYVGYDLMAAVTPWIGNLLIQPRATLADSIRERVERKPLPPGPAFQLLLRSLKIDANGCKEMIHLRRSRPRANHADRRWGKPNTVAWLRRRRHERERMEIQHQLILKLLEEAQQLTQAQQLLPLQCTSPAPPQLLLQGPSPAPPQLLLQGTSPAPPQLLLQGTSPAPPQLLLQGTSPAPPQLLLQGTSPATPQLLLRGTSPAPPQLLLQCTSSAPPQLFLRCHSPAPPQPLLLCKSTAPLQPLLHGSSPAPPQLLLLEPQQASQITVMAQSAPSGGGASITPPAPLRPPAHPAGGAAPITPLPHCAPQSRLPTPTSVQQNISSTLTNEKAAPGSAQHPPRDSREGEVQKVSCSSSSEAEVVKIPLEGGVIVSSRHLHPAAPSSVTAATPATTPSNQLTASRSPCFSILMDHQYTPVNGAPTRRRRGLKRKHEKVQHAEVQQSSQQDISKGEASPGVKEGRRVQKPSQKALTLLEATGAEVETKKRKCSYSQKANTTASQLEAPRLEAPQLGGPQLRGPPLSCVQSNPSLPSWVMTPAGLVQLTPPAAPQNPPLVLIPGPTGPLPPQKPVAPPTLPRTIRIQPLPVPSVSSPRMVFPPPHSPRLFSPFEGKARADLASPQPPRMEDLQIDGSLMFLEPAEAVCDWLRGHRGVWVPGPGPKLPYLPPSISSLSMLSALLQVRRSLLRMSLQLLDPDPRPQNLQSGPQNLQSGPQNLQSGPRNLQTDPQNLQTRPRPSSPAEPLSQTPPGLPDSTCNLAPVQPGDCDSSNTQQEEQEQQLGEEEQQEQIEEEQLEEKQEQLLVEVRRMVSERFSSNPAYQLLKARFLSCFTVPALLATIQPIREKEEGEEEEEELQMDFNQILEGSQSEEGSLLLSDITGAPANHFSGMVGASPDKTGSSGEK